MAKGLIRKASDEPDIEYVTTGFKELDEIVKFPRKRITEVYGLQSVGKTSLMLKSLGGLIADGHKVLYIDVENSFHKERAEALGINLDKLDIATVFGVEEIMELIIENVSKYDAIVVDSVAAMIPLGEMEGKPGDANMGLKARLMGQLMRMVSEPLHKSNCALIFINQLRENMEMFSAKYSTPGGMALKFAASLRIELKTYSKDKIVRGGEKAGHWINATITKSKVGAPGKVARFKLMYDGSE